jgi:hypothetical protein
LHSFLLALAVKDSLAGVIQLELVDDNVGGVDANRSRGTVDLFTGDTFDVDNPLLTVDLDDLAFTTLVGTTDNGNFVVTTDRHGADLSEKGRLRQSRKRERDRTYTVLFTEFLGQRSAHDLLTEMRRGREVSLSALSTGRANIY